MAPAGTKAPRLVPAGATSRYYLSLAIAGGCRGLSVAHFNTGWSHQPVLIGSHGHSYFGPVLNLHVSTGLSRDWY